jgi:hypothetical protein
MTRHLITTALAVLSVSCVGPRGSKARTPATEPTSTQPAVAAEPSERDWIGVYASTSEIGGFAGTVLVLHKWLGKDIGYRLRSYSDSSSANDINQDEQHGGCLIEGRSVYLPKAYGYMSDGKPQLLASITRYTFVQINGRNVLMRDDALRAFREQNKLYDYGILVKVKDEAGLTLDLRKVEHPSIKVLYADPAKPWNDPFVHGANSR